MDIKITKRELLKELNNDMCHNYYWLIKGRIYNDDGSAYRRFHFVEWFDLIDVQEFWTDEDAEEYAPVTESQIKEFLNECIWCRLSDIKSFDDCKLFYTMCDKTINDYNDMRKHW